MVKYIQTPVGQCATLRRATVRNEKHQKQVKVNQKTKFAFVGWLLCIIKTAKISGNLFNSTVGISACTLLSGLSYDHF